MATKPRKNVDPSDVSSAIYDMVSATFGIIATPGGGQANAKQLTSTFNRIGVVASNFDSVKLPKALAGAVVYVINRDVTETVSIFPTTGDRIDLLGINAAYNLEGLKRAQFICCRDGNWDAFLSA